MDKSTIYCAHGSIEPLYVVFAQVCVVSGFLLRVSRYRRRVKFSERVELNEPNAVTLAQRAARRDGMLKVNLADSNPTRWGLGAPGLPPYEPDPRGPRAAREVLAAWLGERDGREVDPENLYLLSSTSQGYTWSTKLTSDPGDRLAAPTPGYPLVETIAGLENVGVDFYPLTWVGSRWELSELNPGEVSAVVAINPNNPTGSYVHGEDRQRLLNYCADRGVALIADEVFFDFDLPGAPTQPADRRRLAGTTEVLTFALDGMSKNLSAPGLKIAWLEVSGPERDVVAARARLDVIADAYLPFSDVLAQRLTEYLAAVPAATSATRQRCRENLATLRDLVRTEPSGTVSLLEPEGGWNALLRFPAHVDEDALITGLIARRGITAQPGYFFDMPFVGVVSVSLLLDAPAFQFATKALLASIADQL